jgi:hypothetical protein
MECNLEIFKGPKKENYQNMCHHECQLIGKAAYRSVPPYVDRLLWYISPAVTKQSMLRIACYQNPG